MFRGRLDGNGLLAGVVLKAGKLLKQEEEEEFCIRDLVWASTSTEMLLPGTWVNWGMKVPCIEVFAGMYCRRTRTDYFNNPPGRFHQGK